MVHMVHMEQNYKMSDFQVLHFCQVATLNPANLNPDPDWG